MSSAAALGELRSLLLKDNPRTPWAPVAVGNGTLWPLLLFAYCYLLGISRLRFDHLHFFLLLSLLPGVAVCLLATLRARSAARNGERSRMPTAVAIGLWCALLSGAFLAEQNYRWFTSSYYSFQDMASYTDIDPNVDVGQSYMDAGQVYFKEGSTVQVGDMVAYRSQNNYCAAPILSAPIWNPGSASEVERSGALLVPQSGTVDFWAVGINCCNTSSKSFQCGAVGDPNARAGLRLLRDDARPYFMLAVEQWTARLCPLDDNSLRGNSRDAPRMCLPAKHPLFFHWVVDPLLEVDDYYSKSLQMAATHTFLFAVGSLLLSFGVLYLLFTAGVH